MGQWFLITFLKAVLQTKKQSANFDNMVVPVACLISLLWLQVHRFNTLWIESPSKAFKCTLVGVVAISLSGVLPSNSVEIKVSPGGVFGQGATCFLLIYKSSEFGTTPGLCSFEITDVT